MNGKQIVVTGGNGAGSLASSSSCDRAAPPFTSPTSRPSIWTDEKQRPTYFAERLPLWASTTRSRAVFAVADRRDLAAACTPHQGSGYTADSLYCGCQNGGLLSQNGTLGRSGLTHRLCKRPVLVPAPGMTAYVAAKAGVAAITQSLAAELGKDGILVNAVLPSTIDTPANRASMPKADPTHWVTVDSLAGVIAFLLSDASRDISGAAIPVYGRA
jgi:NAD(P)-dependent dehydrogenase (short-subunit alcohol dehydrogenase family)